MRKFLLPLLLLLFSVISLTTLSSIVPALLYKQLIAFAISFFIFFLASFFPFSFYLRLAPYLYLVINILLLVLLFYGKVTRGITAWISLPFDFRFQPSQLAFPLTALYLASRHQQEKSLSWREIFQNLFIIALPAILIFLEPDFGVAFILFASLLSFLFFQKLSWQKLFLLSSAALLCLLIIWAFLLKPYQKDRISSHFSGQTNQIQEITAETSSNYNSRQALIAIGSGQLWGRGLGQGVQSHLRFLPERQTDFIFASFTEEWGFVGALAILFLYIALLSFLLYVNRGISQFSAKLFLLATFMLFLIQIFINIGMNLAIMPITGVTLPFLSYGGSSLLSFFFLMGIVQSLLQQWKKSPVLSFY